MKFSTVLLIGIIFTGCRSNNERQYKGHFRVVIDGDNKQEDYFSCGTAIVRTDSPGLYTIEIIDARKQYPVDPVSLRIVGNRVMKLGQRIVSGAHHIELLDVSDGPDACEISTEHP
jgi:hypothetical protein